MIVWEGSQISHFLMVIDGLTFSLPTFHFHPESLFILTQTAHWLLQLMLEWPLEWFCRIWVHQYHVFSTAKITGFFGFVFGFFFFPFLFLFFFFFLFSSQISLAWDTSCRLLNLTFWSLLTEHLKNYQRETASALCITVSPWWQPSMRRVMGNVV